VWARLERYLDEVVRPAGPEDFHALVAEYPRRQGKYFRPGLLRLSAALHGADSGAEAVLLAAAAMQCSEEWLLVHDDIEDGAEERRSLPGQPRPALQRLAGDARAINAGDALHVLMWRIVLDLRRLLAPAVAEAVGRKFADLLLATTAGQHRELTWIAEGALGLAEADYYAMIDAKAGLYTVTGPLQLGALLAGAPEGQAESLRAWGVPFGRAFQIWDDVMNVTVETAEQGKERGGDILEGKRTLLLLHLLGACPPDERRQVEAVYARPRAEKTAADAAAVIELMRRHGSIEHASAQARAFARAAREAFAAYRMRHPGLHPDPALESAIDFVVNRVR
jgi:geranylgeranyl diphosphate synthase, type II